MIHFFIFEGIEDLCTKRDELQRQILVEEDEKSKLQNDIRILTEKLAKVNESLAKKISSRNEYDKMIADTETAYMKVHFCNIFVSACHPLYHVIFQQKRLPFFVSVVFDFIGSFWL